MAEGPGTQTITSSSEQQKSVPIVTVESFYNSHAEKLQMKLEGARVGVHRKIREPTINRPGLALSGFYTYFAGKRVQVLGAAEHSYLKSLAARVRVERFCNLCEHKIPCLVMSRGFHLAPELLSVTGEAKIAVFRTPMITMKFINAATIALEMDFSPMVTEFGSMVDILGIGVLIRGVSGIGSIRVEKRLDLVVTLKEWADMEEVDRIGLDREFYEILGLKVPHVTIPVRPGRDMARLIEVAAMDEKLKGLGQNAAVDFNTRLLRLMEQQRAT